MKYYVAYGSNLNLVQMAARCPNARVYGTGHINNWELIYRGVQGNSHATIRRKKGSSVPVLVWEITESDERNLDHYEGYPRYYFKQNIFAEVNGRKKKSMVYIMDLSRSPGRPSQSYIEVIRQGYIDNNLDMEYFEDSLRRNRIEQGRFA
ncbi:MAG: gamma-glutamylcyclotransferase [Lachnospiraceae bacterium]|nr:gamma-glutamylcyclotransferase [Lachnospiraceae bacterium]